jgi:hypothetical protein
VYNYAKNIYIYERRKHGSDRKKYRSNNGIARAFPKFPCFDIQEGPRTQPEGRRLGESNTKNQEAWANSHLFVFVERVRNPYNFLNRTEVHK